MPYHIPIIAVQLTRHLDDLFDDVLDEITRSLNDTIHLSDKGVGIFSSFFRLKVLTEPYLDYVEWAEIHAHDAMMDIVTRASSRAFVGLPLCTLVPISLHIKCLTNANLCRQRT